MPTLRALIVQHEHDGPAGRLGDHLSGRGYQLDVLQVMEEGSTHSEVAFPDPTAYDLIVPLGSVHGVYDHDVIGSWVHRELEMLRAAHDAEVPVLGICFGGQAMAAALGGSVEPAPGFEIGWYRYDTDGPQTPAIVGEGPWFTWHGDRFHLSDPSTRLASTEMCTQMFRSGRTVGLQFHPEVTRELIAEWAAKLPERYFQGKGIDLPEILAGFDVHGDDMSRRASQLFDWFLDDVAAS